MVWLQIGLTCLSGVFALLSALLPILIKRSDQKKVKAEKDFEQRPNLEIEEYFKLHKYDENEECELNVIITRPVSLNNGIKTKYDKEDLNKDGWLSVVYKLKNIGKIQINTIRVSTDRIGNTDIFKPDEFEDYVLDYKELKYYVNFDRILRSQESVTLRIIYPYELKYMTRPRYNVSLWLTDINKKWWQHELNAPKRELSESMPTNELEFRKWNDLRHIFKDNE